MFHLNRFGILGGDKRQLYCGKSIADDGYSVLFSGFDRFDDSEHLIGDRHTDAATLIRQCDALLLPLPCTRDGVTLHAPFSSEILSVDRLLPALGDTPVFCGMADKLPFSGDLIFDYSKREEFAVENAVPTSEGAIAIAMQEAPFTVHGSRCLITGFGRIGRVLSRMLYGLGAKVTVSARSLRDIAFIRASGMNALSSERLQGEYDFIFNTVPFRLLDAPTLARITTSDTIVIDLASLPGGVDDEGAGRLSLRVIHALSLPGKAAPKTAGIIIKNAVYHIIREEQL